MSISSRIILGLVAPTLFVALLIAKLAGAPFPWAILLAPIPVEALIFVTYCRTHGLNVGDCLRTIARRIFGR